MQQDSSEHLYNLVQFVKENVLKEARKSNKLIDETRDGIIYLLEHAQSTNVILERYKEAYRLYRYYTEEDEQSSEILLEQEELRNSTSAANLCYELKNNHHLILRACLKMLEHPVDV